MKINCTRTCTGSFNQWGEVDERLPECPDVEEKWEEIAKAYIPDGIKEFNDYPTASLGWMMYIGMAVIFNFAGQRLDAPKKGLNIVNGKKVMMK